MRRSYLPPMTRILRDSRSGLGAGLGIGLGLGLGLALPPMTWIIQNRACIDVNFCVLDQAGRLLTTYYLLLYYSPGDAHQLIAFGDEP